MSVPGDGRQVRFHAHPDATEVVLVRHGESAAGLPGDPWPFWGPHGNPELHPAGREQAELVCARLIDEGVDAVVVTPLVRTAQTAAPLLLELAMTATVEPGLVEACMGEWEGPPFREHTKTGHPLALQMEAEGHWRMIPGAEDPDAFATRVVGAVAGIHARHPGRRVAVFAHGFVIAQLAAHATGGRLFAFRHLDNASITRIVVHGDTWTLRSYNDVSHLG